MAESAVLAVGPLQANCYAVWERKDAAVLIDAGDEADRIAAWLEGLGVRPALLLTTHGHFDHVGAVEPLKARFGAPYRCHEAELSILHQVPAGTRLWGIRVPEPPTPDGFVRAGERLDVGGLRLTVLHTPGHTPGSLSFHAPVLEAAFTGDTLFMGSIGRSDFPGGDHEQLLSSIRTRLLSLPPPTRVLAGHGPSSTIGEEAELNPWLA